MYNRGQEKIENQGNTNEISSVENRGNSPYEEKKLSL